MSRPKLEGRDYTHFGLYVPRDFLRRLDEEKGPYYSRNKYILKILTEHLNENESTKNLQGSRISAPASQAVVEAATTATTTHATTPSRTAQPDVMSTTSEASSGVHRVGSV
jgi:hypothetical protein